MDYGYEDWADSVRHSRALPGSMRYGAGGGSNYEMSSSGGNRTSVVLFAADGNMNVRPNYPQGGGGGGGGSARTNNRKSSFFPQFDVPGVAPGRNGSSSNLNLSAVNVPQSEKKVPVYKRESALLQLLVTIFLLLASLALLFVGAGCILATCDQLVTNSASCPKISFFTVAFCGPSNDPNAGIAMLVVGFLVFPATIWSFCTMSRPRFKLSGYQDANASTANLVR